VTPSTSTRMSRLMRLSTSAAAVAALLGLATACTTARPPRSASPRAAVVAPAPALAPDGGLALPLSGDYIATLKAPLLGEVSGRITARPTETGFEAWTRTGVAWDMIGGLEGLFGPIFVKSLFPDGSILTWTSTLPRGESPGEGSLGPGDVKNAQARTRMTSPASPVELLSPDGRRVATLTLRPATEADATPRTDYPALAEGVEDAMRARLFDRSLLTSSQVRGYIHQLKSNAKDSRDDIEFIFGAVVAGRANVSFALPLVFKAMDPDWKTQVTSLADAGLATYKVTYEEPTGIATLKCEAFIDADDVDRAFRQVLAFHPKSLLIDLRGCPGVTLASLRLASWVIDQPQDAGTFFGPTMRDAAKAGHAGEFPRLELNSASSVEEIEHHLDTRGGARIVIAPEPDHFTGPVAVLTSRKTTTSAESLVWALKGATASPPVAAASRADAPPSPRIRLFGQPTAGRPTLSRPIDIGQGWVAWLPALDYTPPAALSKERPDRGCRPNYENGSKEKSKQAARAWLQEQSR
jgi:hypothetical protein